MAGVGKQRIAAEIGPIAALEAANLLLDAALEDAGNWDGPVVISPASADDRAWAANLVQGGHVIPQPAGNLGERIQAVDNEIRTAGGRKIIFIGSDSPDLDSNDLAQAVAALEQSDAVFIPADDGGVTLLGARRHWPALAELPWESGELGAALNRCCTQNGLSTAALQPGFDIDTRQNLIDAFSRLSVDPRPSRIRLCEWIAATLEPDQGLRISAVVAVHNDREALENLLTSLAGMLPEIHEVIVADGENSVGCQQLCTNRGATHIASIPNRGVQLRSGAGHATGNVLWFLHADSNPVRNSVKLIRDHLRDGQKSGFFRFAFTGNRRWYKTLLESAINLRTRAGIPYGDQGLFVTTDAYWHAGGHAETPLFEEVPLIRNLRRLGKCSAADGEIGVSARRWERDGWLWRSLHNRYLALAFALGVAPDRLAKQYNRANAAATDANG
jgi:rSAM/selenodomain-associated transferase 2